MDYQRWLVLVAAIVSLQACHSPGVVELDALSTAPSLNTRIDLVPDITPPDEIIVPPIDESPAPPPPDLWQTMRDGFALSDESLSGESMSGESMSGESMSTEPLASQPRLRAALNWVATQPNLLAAMEPRAQRYLPYVVQEVRARGLPLELALLPIVESTLDPYAASPQGAAGLWQLIPATARRYGVAMNWWYDGRRDVVDSTDAALDYLVKLHSILGDWLLAIAAYNCGEQRILRQLERDPTATFWTLELPRETDRYVPRLLALAAMIRSPGKFGTTLPALDLVQAFGVATIEDQVDLQSLAKYAGIPIDEIFRLNAGLNHAATPPEGPHRVLVPLVYLESFETAVDRYASDVPRWSSYRVRNGDTLSTIAKRHGTSVKAIRDANALRGHLIRAGTTLVIPRSAVATSSLATNPLLRSHGKGTTYRVANGDSLWSISRRFGTSVGAIVRANRLNPKAPLAIGQVLRVPGRNRDAA